MPAAKRVPLSRLEKIKETLRAGDAASAWRDLKDVRESLENSYEYQQLAGVVALQTGNSPAAEAAFTAALGLTQNPARKAAAVAGLAEVMLVESKPDLAEQYARQALALHRRNLDYHQLLARCYGAQGLVDKATAFLETSMLSMPAKVRFAFQLQIADILIQASRAQDALPFIKAVEREQPGNADVLIRKATAMDLLGLLDEATEYYLRLLKVAPGLPIYTRLAKVSTAAGNESLIPLLEEKLATSRQSDVALRTNLHFALAYAYDIQHQYDAAFDHLKLANDLKHSVLNFSLDQQQEAFARIAAFFSSALITRLAGKVPEQDGVKPIFIFGMPRSGTTLVEQILSAHSQVRGAGELPFLDQITIELGRKWEMSGCGMPSDRQLIEDFDQAAHRYQTLIARYAGGAHFVTDKMPLNFRHLGLIRLLFPDALLIHCERDLRDTCLSCYQQLFISNNLSFTYDLQDLGGFYRVYRQYMAHWTEVLGPHAWFTVQYESLVGDINGTVRELLDYCHLPFEQACVEFHKSERTVLTASSIQVRRPLYSDAIGKWRHYETHLKPLLTALGRQP